MAEARYHFERSIALKPDFGEAHLNYGRLLVASGETAAAGEHLRIAAQASDANVKAAAQQLLQTLGQ
jgi:Tfp pilus assembly protein PilF